MTEWIGPGLTIYLSVSFVFVLAALWALRLISAQLLELKTLTQEIKKLTLEPKKRTSGRGVKQKND